MASEEEKINPATDPRRQFGNRGEDLAAAFFIQKGFEIVARNWSCRLGEIDLIVEKDGALHFVEVKIRQSLVYGYPEEAITRTKLKHLARAIETYLRATPSAPLRYQADALAILAEPGRPPEYYYIEQIL